MAEASVRMNCPHCGAAHRVVQVEAPSDPVEVTCRGPLQGRNGKFVLKYFLVDRRRKPSPTAQPGIRVSPTPPSR